MSVVLTSTEKKSGRGGLTLWASALGLALVVGGGVASARSAADRGQGDTAPPVPAAATAAPGAPAAAAPAAQADRPRPDAGAEPPTKAAPEPKGESAPKRHPAKGTPQRIVVPSLGIDHPIVGIDAPGGVLTPPSDPQVLGWWQSGAQPGARRGSALVTGHTVSSGGGAFDDLETLRRGDRVSIGTSNGSIDYRVTGARIYRKASLAEHAQRVFSQDVPGRLVLITCEDWNGSVYLSNAVVIARPVA